jgi:hypothetical protein
MVNEKAARERLAACENAAAKAKAAHVTRAEEAARAGKPLPSPSTMRATNVEIADAAEAVEAAGAAVAHIVDRLSGLERELRRAQSHVARAVDDVIRATSVAQLVAQARQLQDDLVGRRLALYFLFNQGLVSEREQPMVAALLGDDAIPMAVCFNGRAITARHTKAGEHDGAKAWREARSALARDAQAELPS